MGILIPALPTGTLTELFISSTKPGITTPAMVLFPTKATKWGGPFFCVVPNIHPDRAEAIAGHWEFIASRKESIGYALHDDPDALFDLNTGRLTMPNGLGLSCSTFVLVLFRSVKLDYINTKGWPIGRPGDKEWQQKLLEILEKTCDDKAHIEGVRKEIENGCERVRPEEVAGTALYDDLPVGYAQAEDAGFFAIGALCALGHIRKGMN